MADAIEGECTAAAGSEYDTNTDANIERPFYYDNHAEAVVEASYDFYRTGEFCDLILEADVDKKRFNVHRIVLAASSQYIKAVLTQSMPNRRLINIDVNGDHLQPIIEFCYTSKILINDANIDDIILIASRLQIDRIRHLCGEYLIETLSLSNCLNNLLMANKYAIDEATKVASNCVFGEFRKVIKGDEFKEINDETLAMLLSCENINIYSEEEAFEALTIWIDENVDGRKAFFPKLFHLIRIEQLKEKFLLNRVASYAKQLGFEDFYATAMDKCANGAEPRLALPRSIPAHPAMIRMRGNDQTNETDIFQYNPILNDWILLTTINVYRRMGSFCTILIDSDLYILGGTAHNHADLILVQRVNLDSLLVVNLAPMPTARGVFMAAHLNGFIYVLGGTGCSYIDEIKLECYNIAINQWTVCASFIADRKPSGRYGEYRNTYGVSLYPFNDRLYAIGGQWYGPGELPDICPKVTYYEPTVDAWSEASDMIEPKIFPKNFIANGSLHITGGQFPGYQFQTWNANEPTTIERFDANANQWVLLNIQADGMPFRFWQVAYANNHLYVFGANLKKKHSSIGCAFFYKNVDFYGMLNLETQTWTKLGDIADEIDLDRKTVIFRLPYDSTK